MERAFADTSYWIALVSPRDYLHDIARAASLRFGPSAVVTSEIVLTEFLNSLSDYGPKLRQAAAKAVQTLRGSGVRVVPQSTQLFARSLERYSEMADKSWSLTDCSSFLIMEDEGISLALTHDRHFAQAGFQALLR